MVGRLPAPRSGREWQGAQSGQGVTELGFPGPALGKMQGEAACGVGEPSGDGEEPPPEGLGGDQLLPQTDARGPAGQQPCWMSSIDDKGMPALTTCHNAVHDGQQLAHARGESDLLGLASSQESLVKIPNCWVATRGCQGTHI